MKVRIFDDMTQCTQADIDRLLPLVSTQRRNYALRYKHLFGRWATLKTYEILYTLLYPDAPLDVHTLTFSFNTYGKPYLPDGPHFSISHCKSGLAVIAADTPVGIDIESPTRSVSPELIAHTMNDIEQARIRESDNPTNTFIRLWTQKEAVLKCLGTGITTDLKTVLPTEDIDVTTYETDNLIYSIAISPQK